MALRCGTCGATNPDSATWCNQCLTDLAVPGAGVSRDASASMRAGPGGVGADSPPPTGPSSTGGSDALLRRGPEGVQWRCPTCDGWSSLDDDVCARCGTPLQARFAGHPAPGRDAPGGTGGADMPTGGGGGRSARPDPSTARNRTIALNAVLPGLGHLLAGWVGSGLARIVLFGVWLIGGVLLWGAGGPAAALPLLLGAAVLWATGIVDAWLLFEGARQVLSGRALLWLVVGVTLFATVGVVTVVVSGPA